MLKMISSPMVPDYTIEKPMLHGINRVLSLIGSTAQNKRDSQLAMTLIDP